MSKLRFISITVSALVIVLATSSFAAAQADRTWVSGVGDDANPCSRTAPCKTFAGAISKTANGGEIDALDPGGFGQVTVFKPLTIDGGTGAGWASIVAPGTNAIIVNNSLGGNVILRNLSLNGVNGVASGMNGINILTGQRVHVENVKIQNFTQAGINVATSALTLVWIQDVNIDESTTAIQTTTSSSVVVAHLDNVRVQGNQDGFMALGNTSATIRNCYFGNQFGSNGAVVVTNSTVNVEDSAIYGNVQGIVANAGADIRLSNDAIYDNSNGIVLNGGLVRSVGNNRVFGNTMSAAPNGGPVTIQ